LDLGVVAIALISASNVFAVVEIASGRATVPVAGGNMAGSGSVVLIIKASMWVLAVLLIGAGVVSFVSAAETGDGQMLWLSLAVAVFGPPLVCGPVYLLCRVRRGS